MPAGLRARVLWIAVGAGAAALVCTSAYRAVVMPISHDESITYSIFNGQGYWATTANNHLLNTYLMRLCVRLFGSSELAVRLPNVTAQLFYLAAIVYLLTRVRRALVLPGFLLLTLNLFQFDYFGVARGYGLELSLLAVSLACFVAAIGQHGQERRWLALVACALAAGFGSVLANFSAFYYYAALLGACAVSAAIDPARVRIRRSGWLPIVAVLGVASLLMLAVVVRGTRMQSEHMFYEGGESGFFGDTIVSLVQASLYLPGYRAGLVRAVAISVVALVGFYAGFGAWSAWRAPRREAVPAWLSAILLIAVLLPVAQHALTGFLLPVDRQALFYVPLAWLVVIFAADLASALLPRARMAIAAPLWIAAAVAAVVFVRGFNPLQCHSCRFDAHMKEVLGLIDRDRRAAFPAEQISVTINWLLEPQLNFYRTTRGLRWLAPLTRDPLDPSHHQYLYAYADDVARLPDAPHTALASFADSGTVLWRVAPGVRP